MPGSTRQSPQGALEAAELWVIGRWPSQIRWKRAKTFPPCAGPALAGLLRQCHVYVTGSKHEPGAMHPVEGLQCGLPLLYDRETGGTVELGRKYGMELSEDAPESIMRIRARLRRTSGKRPVDPPSGDAMCLNVPPLDPALDRGGTLTPAEAERPGASGHRLGSAFCRRPENQVGAGRRLAVGASGARWDVANRPRPGEAASCTRPGGQARGGLVPMSCEARKLLCFVDNAPSFYARQPEFHAVRPLVDKWIARSTQAVHQLATLGIEAELAPYCADPKTFFPLPREDAGLQASETSTRTARRRLRHRQLSFRHGVHDRARPAEMAERIRMCFAEIIRRVREVEPRVCVLLAGPRRHWLRAALEDLACACVLRWSRNCRRRFRQQYP